MLSWLGDTRLNLGCEEQQTETLNNFCLRRDNSKQASESGTKKEKGTSDVNAKMRSSLFVFFFSVAILLDDDVFGGRAHALGGVSLNSNSGLTPVVEKTYDPEEKNVQGLIQAGFPREKAEKVLRAIGNENCCGPQIKWLFAHDLERNVKRNELKKHESCFTSEHTDYDGYANVWGGQNKQPDAGACCQSCKDYVPKPPNYYPCNVWVYCPKAHGCFAPAAGEFKYQDCWLKYQHDPIHVHVNMKGAYSAEYRASHPTAPEMVDWTAGVVLTEEEYHRSEGDLNHTWSARSHWRKLLA